jgi:hypothetical protein
MAAQGYEVLLTIDQNVRYQQNLGAAGVAVVVLVAASNRVTDLIPLMASARRSLGSLQPGTIVEITN